MMTIGNYGTMEIKDNNTLTSFVSLYFPLWYYQFNYENYTSNIYPKLLNSTYDSSNNEETHKLNIEYVISQKKTLNDLIIWELKTIESQLISINKYLQELNIFDIHLNFNSKRHERTYKEILIRLENYESRTQGEIHLIEIIRNADENWLLYFLGILLKDYNRIKEFLIKNVDTEIQTSEPQQSEKGKDKKPKYIWKSKHALSGFYKKVNDNFFEDLSLDDFLDVFTESNKMRLNAINYNQTDIGYLFDNVKPYFIDKVQANYLDWISTKVLFNGKEKKPKAISEILNFHKSKKVEYKESIDEILKSLTPFIK